MSRFKLAFLGPLLIKNDDVLVRIDRRKATALLSYLTVNNQQYSRDSLATMFWPDFDGNQGRAALRRTLCTLKAVFGDYLDADRQNIVLNFDSNIWIDVHEFINLLAECEMHGHPSNEVCPLCIRPLTEAVKLYRNEFLAGFGLSDSVEFDDWQTTQAQYLRHHIVSALERLVFYHHTHRHAALATIYACRWMEIDPSHELGHRYVMHLYATSGRRVSALRQYERCVRILETQIGILPQEETIELYEAIRTNKRLPSLGSLVSCISIRGVGLDYGLPEQLS